MREMAAADALMIEKYMAAIKAEDRVPEGEYERRLSLCKECVIEVTSRTCISQLDRGEQMRDRMSSI